MIFNGYQESLLLAQQYLPHGGCYLWQSELVGLHAVSDGLTALSYFVIPIAIIYLIRKRNDLPFQYIFLLFGAFIIACGMTHAMEIITLWYPIYWVSGVIKLITALISLFTVIELIPVLPKILALPSPGQLEMVNQQLQEEIQDRKKAEQQVRQINQELEKRVEERTAELAQSKQIVQSMADVNPAIIYIYNAIEDKVTYISQAVKRLLGYHPEQITQSNDSSHVEWTVHPDDKPKKYDYHKKLSYLKDGEVLELEYRVQDAQQNWHWLYSSCIVFSRTETGEVAEILGISNDITPRKEAEENLQKMNQDLNTRIDELTKRNEEMELLAEMIEFLQSCITIEEASDAMPDLLESLFPNCSGAIFLMNASGNLVEMITCWGKECKSQSLFSPQECWALRRLRPHRVDDHKTGLFCSHISHNPYPKNSLCVPLMAQRETLGIFCLQTDEQGGLTTAKRQLARNVSEQLSLALANLKLQENLQYQSIRDGLTGLYNRRYLSECLEREIDRAEKLKQSIGMIMIDIDYFKQLNDTWGHIVGDYILKQIGNLVRENLRCSDLACRYGGEEFAVIIFDSTSKDTYQCAEKLRQGIKNLHLEYNQYVLPQITVSLGVAVYPQDGNHVETLINLADTALYQAKKQGRDRAVTTSEIMVP